MLQELFGLTAPKRITTVYTHLRRTREKTGWKSVAELTRRFNELNTTLQPN